MAIELLKQGQTIDLTKNRSNLTNITVGLSWGKTTANQIKNENQKGGLLGKLFQRGKAALEEQIDAYVRDMDIDSSVLLLDTNNKLLNKIYYGNKSAQGVKHLGDDLTGNDKKGVYDNEEIEINLSQLPNTVNKLVFVANIFGASSRNQHFGMVKGAYIRVLNSKGREEIIHYDLAGEYNKHTALIVGELYRYHNEWKFRAIGEGTMDSSIESVARRYK